MHTCKSPGQFRARRRRMGLDGCFFNRKTRPCGNRLNGGALRVAPRRGVASAPGLKEGTMQSVADGALNAHERLLIDQAIAEYQGRPGALLGILEAVQAADSHKFLSMESLRYIADET